MKGPLHASSESGQAMLISIMLLLILGIAAVSGIVSYNRQLALVNARSSQRQGALQAAGSGANQTIWALSQDAITWDAAMATPTATFQKLGLDGKTIFQWSPSDRFTIKASTGPPGLPYQIQTIVTSVDRFDKPLRAAAVSFSQRKIGALMPTSESATAGLAYFGSQPLAIDPAKLEVDWGPVINFSADTQITAPVAHYPRQFGVGGVSPYTTSSQDSGDGKEYWAYTSLGQPPKVNFTNYKNTALSSTIPPDSAGDTNGFITSLNVSFNNYLVQKPTKVIYLSDPGQVSTTTFHTVGIETQATLVDGSLVLDTGDIGTSQNHGLLPSAGIQVAVPPTAMVEYPTNPVSHAPYSVVSTGVCATGQSNCPLNAVLGAPTPVDFHGFLYVRNNLIVRKGNWLIVGQVRVDGQIIFENDATLHVVMDDLIAHAVKVDRVIVQKDIALPIAAGKSGWVKGTKTVRRIFN